ncbi:2-hydroxyacid dehydrogenase [Patescibacteria group bacterium]
MSKPKVFVTRHIPEAGLKMLRQKFNVEVRTAKAPISRAELIKKIKGKDALLCLLTDQIDGEVLDAADPQLKIVANFAVGFDNIDLEAAKERGILVTNTPNASTEAVAEHTLALLFAAARRIIEGDRFMRAGKYKYWEPELLQGSAIKGKTLGIIGLGRIGFAVAERATDEMGMKCLYTDLHRNPTFEKLYHGKRATLETLLKKSDFITLHVPLLPSTRHLISAKELNMMKKTAYLINTSRGPVVNEKALVTALKNHKIAGAALDVYEFEPKMAPGLKTVDHVTLTPHIASSTHQARDGMSMMAAKNIIAALSGRKPPTLADPELWSKRRK